MCHSFKDMAHFHHHSRGHRPDLIPLQSQLAQQRAVRVQRLHQPLPISAATRFYADTPRSQEILVQSEHFQLRQRLVLLHQLADRLHRLLREVVVPHIQHLSLIPRFHDPPADSPRVLPARAAPAAILHRRGLHGTSRTRCVLKSTRTSSSKCGICSIARLSASPQSSPK